MIAYIFIFWYNVGDLRPGLVAGEALSTARAETYVHMALVFLVLEQSRPGDGGQQTMGRRRGRMLESRGTLLALWWGWQLALMLVVRANLPAV